ncbi:MAG: bifunctional tetrahydrofolate synthase/dihydrofolate synthase [Pseudomonadales bacterium]|jgi:dihydrofolate synthase/folylpolyglutamate synthase|nr:bifunctional tetrahydrofolate synthase/dihydrofolate synthase [Pseudomonadales bacterium]
MHADPAQRSLAEWLAVLEHLHPSTIDLGLDRVRRVYERLQPDLRHSRSVIVGGTNGKGSTVAMLAGALRAAGHSVGTYTSPHLLRYNERVTLDGSAVGDAALCQAFAAVEAVRGAVSLTYFEYGTLAALQLFAQARPDYLLLEIGLGGRLDAVNIVEPELCILTNVALDHVDWLGATREAIGYEKAGIFRAGKPALYGERAVPGSVRAQAEHIGTTLLCQGEHFAWEERGGTWIWRGRDAAGQPLELCDLPRNDFPLDNAAAVVQALQLLAPDLPRAALHQGLAQAQVPGRLQRCHYQGRKVILDVAHNPHAAANLARNITERIRKEGAGRVLLVLGMLGDKDSAGVLAHLVPCVDHIYAATLGGERGAPAEIIYNHARRLGAEATCHPSVQEAFLAAHREATAADTLIVTGSFFTVAAVLELI